MSIIMAKDGKKVVKQELNEDDLEQATGGLYGEHPKSKACKQYFH